MSGRKRGSPGEARADLEAALERLLDNKPTNRGLQALAKAKKLQITIKAVAIEAQRSRTLIGSDACRYPDIRKRILDLTREPGEQPVTTVSKLVVSLRATNAALREELRLTQSQQALMLARVIEAERRADLAEERLAIALNGSADLPRPSASNVAPFPPRPQRGRPRKTW